MEAPSPATFEFTAPSVQLTFTTRPAFAFLKVDHFALKPRHSLRVLDGDGGGEPLTSATLAEICRSIELNSTEPSTAAVWAESQKLIRHFDEAGILSLTVPSGVDGNGDRGKRPALHVRVAAHKHPRSRLWDRDKAGDEAAWFGPDTKPCVGLGVFLYSDMVCLDFDHLELEANLRVFEEVIRMCPADTPREITSGLVKPQNVSAKCGVHLFFLQSAYSREMGLACAQVPICTHVDYLTAYSNATPHFVAVAPTAYKRPVPGCILGEAPLRAIPNALVDALLHRRKALAAAATGEANAVGDNADQRPAQKPRVERAPRLAEAFATGWFAECGQGDYLFKLAGLTDSKATPLNADAFTSRSGCPCPWPLCHGYVHSNNYALGVNAYGTIGLTYYGKAKEHVNLMKAIELDEAVTRRLQDAWWRVHGAASALSRGDGCFYRGGDAVWRVFFPWEVRTAKAAGETGGRCNNGVPPALWRAKSDGTMDVADVAAHIESASHLRIAVDTFLGEFGPSGGATGVGFEFRSRNTCPLCHEVHTAVYRVAIVNVGVAPKTLIYIPCSVNLSGERAGKPRGIMVYKPTPRDALPYASNAELMDVWADGAAQVATVASSLEASSLFAAAVAKIAAATTWQEQLAEATNAYEVGDGKVEGTYAHYRAELSPPTRDGRTQLRHVARITYDHEGGLKLRITYPETGKEFEVGPKTGQRAQGVACFTIVRPLRV